MEITPDDVIVCSRMAVDSKWSSRMVYYSQERILQASKRVFIDMLLLEIKLLHKHRNKPA